MEEGTLFGQSCWRRYTVGIDFGGRPVISWACILVLPLAFTLNLVINLTLTLMLPLTLTQTVMLVINVALTLTLTSGRDL